MSMSFRIGQLVGASRMQKQAFEPDKSRYPVATGIGRGVLGGAVGLGLGALGGLGYHALADNPDDKSWYQRMLSGGLIGAGAGAAIGGVHGYMNPATLPAAKPTKPSPLPAAKPTKPVPLPAAKPTKPVPTASAAPAANTGGTLRDRMVEIYKQTARPAKQQGGQRVKISPAIASRVMHGMTPQQLEKYKQNYAAKYGPGAGKRLDSAYWAQVSGFNKPYTGKAKMPWYYKMFEPKPRSGEPTVGGVANYRQTRRERRDSERYFNSLVPSGPTGDYREIPGLGLNYYSPENQAAAAIAAKEQRMRSIKTLAKKLENPAMAKYKLYQKYLGPSGMIQAGMPSPPPELVPNKKQRTWKHKQLLDWNDEQRQGDHASYASDPAAWKEYKRLLQLYPEPNFDGTVSIPTTLAK